jgi:hypothetical protein
MPVLARVAVATSRAIGAIRRVDPEATVLLCDAADTFQTRDEALRDEVMRRNQRRFLLLDLLMGRVDSHHPLRAWLEAYGFSELDLAWLCSHRQAPDVIGLDYYPHSDWELETGPRGVLQRRAAAPAGLYRVAYDYYARYGLPLLVTETSIEGKPVNRDIWLTQIVRDVRRLRADAVPLAGLVWWPLFDHVDWDGALTHRIGKLHQVGLFKLVRDAAGTLRRVRTPLVTAYAELAQRGDEAVGAFDATNAVIPASPEPEQRPPLAVSHAAAVETPDAPALGEVAPVVSILSARPRASHTAPTSVPARRSDYGIVVFSHLRWGFVWQRPQQLLSRFAKEHPILFVEEPLFDLPEGAPPRLELHRVMPNVTVACLHGAPSWARSVRMGLELRRFTQLAIADANQEGAFDRPLLWYYSPLAAAWSLGSILHRGVVYDCMDELSQFAGAPPGLRDAEQRLLRSADIVFAGGYELAERKRAAHDAVHCFGCGVEYDHFVQANDPETTVPPDIDFIARPIIGWFGVCDERVDYPLLAELARRRPDWSFAMVGPVVKVDPNLLPHAPNLFWLGGRDYSVLPNYCRAFDVCLMCFARNAATEYINPTKALEYLATGRPVVSTPVKDVVRQYTDVMEIASTPGDLVAAIERSLDARDGERVRRGMERARASSWEAIVAEMGELIAKAIERADRRSANPIEPAPEALLDWAPTPGS